MAGPDAQGLDEPVVQRPMHVEFQRADAVGDMLDRVALAVRIVVHGIDAPFVSRAVMVGKLDAVQQRIPEHHVGMGHIDLGAQHLLTLGILAGLHLPEELEVLLHGTVPPGAGRTGLVHGAAVFANLVLRLVVHIGQAALDKLFGPLVQLVEVIGGIQLLLPLEAQPFDVFLDGIYIFRILFGGIGIVVTKVGFAAIFLCETEVEANALGMPQVQVSVGFRRETGHDRIHFSLGQIPFDNLFQKVQFSLFHIYF